MNIQGGSVDTSTYFVLRLAATGVEATGLTIANMDLQYVRTGAAPVAKVDATALAQTDTAHTDNYGIEIDGTDQPGLYRIDWPDAAFAAGAKQVILTVKCATCFTEHLAVDIDPPVNLTNILGHLLAQTGTQLADGFQTFFDVASPTTHKAIIGVSLAADQAVNVTKVNSTAQTAGDLAALVTTVDGVVDSTLARLIALALTTGAVVTDAGNSATAFKTDLASAVNDFWKDALILLTSGALAGQVKKIGAYTGASKIVTLASGETFTATPADDVTFVMINR